MLKKQITFETFDGETITEEFLFHLSKAELAAMELSHKKGFDVFLKEIVEDEDGKAIVETMQEVILMSYGQKSVDGRRFIKNDELREDFHNTDAYSELFVELCTDAKAAAEFMNGVVPAGLANDVATAEPPVLPTAPPVTEPVGTGTDDVDYEAMLAAMPSEEQPKKAITQREFDFMKGRLTPEQFEHFMSTRFVDA